MHIYNLIYQEITFVKTLVCVFPDFQSSTYFLVLTKNHTFFIFKIHTLMLSCDLNVFI